MSWCTLRVLRVFVRNEWFGGSHDGTKGAKGFGVGGTTRGTHGWGEAGLGMGVVGFEGRIKGVTTDYTDCTDGERWGEGFERGGRGGAGFA
jgi:hypothetical protein